MKSETGQRFVAFRARLPRAPISDPELGWLLLLATLWGGSYTLIKVAVETVPPLTVVAVRVTIGAVVLLPVVRVQRRQLPRDVSTWRNFPVQAALLNFVPFTLISWGEQYMASGLAGILNATPPIFTFILTRLWKRHQPATGRQLAGVLLGLVGVLLIVGVDDSSGIAEHTRAELAITLASVCYALAAIWGHRLANIPPLVTTTGTLSCAAAVMLPASLLVDQPWRLTPSTSSLAALAALAVVSTALASLVYFRLLRTLGPIGTTSNSYLRAAASVILGVVLLGEQPTLFSLLGLGMVAASVVTLVSRPAFRGPGE